MVAASKKTVRAGLLQQHSSTPAPEQQQPRRLNQHCSSMCLTTGH
jgi:hypothetical protein